MGLAATFNTNNAYEGPGRISARDTRTAGISWAFTPVLGIGVVPLWPRIYETFGEDPYLASRMGEAAIKGVEGNEGDLDSQSHCASCMKHYAGYPDPKYVITQNCVAEEDVNWEVKIGKRSHCGLDGTTPVFPLFSSFFRGCCECQLSYFND